MRPVSSLPLPALLLTLLPACESGLSTVVEVGVADDVATAGSPDAPGVLVTDAGVSAIGAPLAPVCGGRFEEPVLYSFDFGFGCLLERSGPDRETVRAWIAPMPPEWDAEAFCALPVEGWDGLSIGPDVTGDHDTGDAVDTADTGGADTGGDTGDTGDTGAIADPEPRLAALGLAAEPDPAWPQAAVTATWARDFSPCGGSLRAELTLE